MGRDQYPQIENVRFRIAPSGVLQLSSYTGISKTKCVGRVENLVRVETRAVQFEQVGQHINYSPYRCNSNGYCSLAATHPPNSPAPSKH